MEQILQNIFWNLAEDPQTFRKASQSPVEEGSQKMKIKNETKDFRMGTCTSVRELWGSKSFHTLRNPQGWGQEGAWNFRGEFSNRCSEDKTERIHHRDHCGTALPKEKAHTPVPAAENRGRVSEAQSGSGIWPQGGPGVGSRKNTLRGLVRCSWGSLGGAGYLREARDCNHQDTSWLTHQRPPKPAKLGEHHQQNWTRLQFMIPEEEM